MSIFFISDLHLNERFSDSYRLFNKFFSTLPKTTEAVYILGDLFEAWIDDHLNTEFLNNVKNILKTSSNNIPIYFIRGNRDFLIGKHFAKQTNIKILPDSYKFNLYGHNILLLHGDSLCSLDKRHIYFTNIIRHPITVGLANILPIKLKLTIADQLRTISKNKYKNNNININIVKNLAIYDACQSTVEQIMQQHSVNILIHGHTHKPNIHNFIINQSINSQGDVINNKAFTRIVLGDWNNQAQILEFNKDGYELKTIFSYPGNRSPNMLV